MAAGLLAQVNMRPRKKKCHGFLYPVADTQWPIALSVADTQGPMRVLGFAFLIKQLVLQIPSQTKAGRDIRWNKV